MVNTTVLYTVKVGSNPTSVAGVVNLKLLPLVSHMSEVGLKLFYVFFVRRQKNTVLSVSCENEATGENTLLIKPCSNVKE